MSWNAKSAAAEIANTVSDAVEIIVVVGPTASGKSELALELAPHVRVNGVAPGTVLPPESLGVAEREQLRSRIPLQRFGTAEDVAATVRFLITGSDFVTGQVIAVDGGRVRGSP